MNKNLAIITLDSLRYDTAIQANTPYLNKLMKKYQKNYSEWIKVFAPATYTLPSHISMFSGGIFPCDYNNKNEPYGRWNTLFKYKGNARKAKYQVKYAISIPGYFASEGYRVIGIGGVSWFNDTMRSSQIWHDIFAEFYWEPAFREGNTDSFDRQLDFLQKLLFNNDNEPLFLFINISLTHKPFLGLNPSVKSQAECLYEVDKRFERLLDLVPKPVDILICGDHGECFGEDNKWGHGFYHEKVMEVPMTYLEIN